MMTDDRHEDDTEVLEDPEAGLNDGMGEAMPADDDFPDPVHPEDAIDDRELSHETASEDAEDDDLADDGVVEDVSEGDGSNEQESGEHSEQVEAASPAPDLSGVLEHMQPSEDGTFSAGQVGKMLEVVVGILTKQQQELVRQKKEIAELKELGSFAESLSGQIDGVLPFIEALAEAAQTRREDNVQPDTR